jgi:hypothetical protein
VVVVFRHHEALDLRLEALARASHQHALLLERLDDGEHATDVVDRRVAHVRERGRRDHGADAVAGEELERQRAIVVAADQVPALDAVVARAIDAGKVDADVGGEPVRAGRAALPRRASTGRTAAGAGRCGRRR